MIRADGEAAGEKEAPTHLPLNWDRVISPCVLTASEVPRRLVSSRGSAGAVAVSDMACTPFQKGLELRRSLPEAVSRARWDVQARGMP